MSDQKNLNSLYIQEPKLTLALYWSYSELITKKAILKELQEICDCDYEDYDDFIKGKVILKATKKLIKKLKPSLVSSLQELNSKEELDYSEEELGAVATEVVEEALKMLGLSSDIIMTWCAKFRNAARNHPEVYEVLANYLGGAIRGDLLYTDSIVRTHREFRRSQQFMIELMDDDCDKNRQFLNYRSFFYKKINEVR